MDEKIIDLDFDWDTNYEECGNEKQARADNASDGLLMSLDNKGCVDIGYIAEVSGLTPETVIHDLSGSIYRDPMGWEGDMLSNWVTSDEYLSGSIARKLETAKKYNRVYHGLFDDNVEALGALIEPVISEGEIFFSLGSPWMPPHLIDEFMLHLLGQDAVNGEFRTKGYEGFLQKPYCVRHDSLSGVWEIPVPNRFEWIEHRKNINILYNVYGTQRMSAIKLIDAALNMRTPTTTDEVRDPNTGEYKRVVNKKETMLLAEKTELLQKEFRSWISDSPERRAIVENAYNEKYGNIRRRVFDGSFLTFPTMSENVSLYKYQKDAVARILFSKSTLLAHEVGSGKTYELIASGQELKRTGRSEKNLYVVPNSIVGQWRDIFRQMYPSANVLVVDNKNFNVREQKSTLRKIRDEEYDGIIMASSCFDRIYLSKSAYFEICDEKIRKLERAREEFHNDSGICRRKTTAENERKKIIANPNLNDDGFNFDDLGITFFALDEAHLYKNAGIGTGMTNVIGFGGKCAKSASMMEKVHYLKKHGGRVVFATGTPITNSLCDIFVMQKYLQEEELELLGLSTFEAWASMFADKTTSFEIDIDTNSYHMVTRFSRFCNVPELARIFSSVADFHSGERASGVPDFDGYEISEGDGSACFKKYLKDISSRADKVRNGKVARDEDNLLKITTDGRKAALDMRLIDGNYKDYPESKVQRCAEKIAEIYRETRTEKSAQIVFCDSSAPKPGFNMYDELKSQLVRRGIPESEIAYVHDAVSDAERKKLFEAVNKGKVAVIIGSTAKLGVGVNIQERLCAMHHLDVCWKPSDMVQREGRILRPGNTSRKVRIFRYITKGSFDAYSWQLLENKQKFTEQIIQGCVGEREGGDIDSASLSYAEVKALAVGNPLIKERVETQTKLDKYRFLQRTYLEDRLRKKQELKRLPEEIEKQNDLLRCAKEDFEYSRGTSHEIRDMEPEEKKALAGKISRAVNAFVNRDTDTKICSVAGFDVIVPAHMVPKTVRIDKKNENGDNISTVPYICLCRHGRYYLDVESEKGTVSRINHFLNPYRKEKSKTDGEPDSTGCVPCGLEKLCNNYREQILEMQTRESVLKEELSHEGGYLGQIEAAQEHLSEIDEKLEEAS